MKIKTVKEFIEPVTCVNGPVEDDKYLVHLVMGGEFISTKTFKSMTDIDAELSAMSNDLDIMAAFEEAKLDPIILFEIAEVRSKEEYLHNKKEIN